MRFARGMGWILGGLVFGTCGLMLGASIGSAGGFGVCALCIGGALIAVERGIETW